METDIGSQLLIDGDSYVTIEGLDCADDLVQLAYVSDIHRLEGVRHLPVIPAEQGLNPTFVGLVSEARFVPEVRVGVPNLAIHDVVTVYTGGDLHLGVFSQSHSTSSFSVGSITGCLPSIEAG